VWSAHRGGYHDVTFEVLQTPEAHMLDTLSPPSPPDPIARRADCKFPTFTSSWSDGGSDAAWVHVAGELDIATAPQLQRTLSEAQAGARVVVLNLRELAFTDSAGVKVIVNAAARSREAGRRLVLLRGRANVDRVFTLTRSSERVEIFDVDRRAPGRAL
jgi:anti-sigma B factor antagonist